jgi:hypothetical protein
MKSILKAGLYLLTGITLLATSCKKEDEDEGKLPNIAMKTSAGYTSKDTTQMQNAPLLMGINASKAEDNDVLTLFVVTRSYDNGTPSTVYSETLSGTSGDSYSKDYPITTRTQAGTEKYTFTVTNRDGLTNSVSVKVMVP